MRNMVVCAKFSRAPFLFQTPFSQERHGHHDFNVALCINEGGLDGWIVIAPMEGNGEPREREIKGETLITVAKPIKF